MTHGRLAVIIPAFHAADTIERAVRSVLSQPRVRAQVLVVVDDEEGTTEQTLLRLNEPTLRIMTNPGNLGAQKSRNRGLAAIDAEYVMFLDSDDFVMGDLLDGLITAMADGSDIAFGPWLFYDETGNRAERRRERYASAADLLDSWLVARRWTPPCAVLWRTEFLRKIGGWDESLRRNQDGAVVCKAALAGARLSHSDLGCGVYVQHDSPLRVSRSRSTFGDLVEVAESLLAQPSPAISDPERRQIVGDYFYWLADSAFRRGDLEEARLALRRCADLGGRNRSNAPMQKFGAAVLGLERYRRLADRTKRL